MLRTKRDINSVHTFHPFAGFIIGRKPMRHCIYQTLYLFFTGRFTTCLLYTSLVKTKKKGIIAKCRSIIYQPRFKLGCFILADIDTFGNLHIERHQQTAVEPDSDVGYTVPVYDELFVRPDVYKRQFTGCRSCFRWLLQSNKIAAAANLFGGRWGRQKEGFENFIIRCSLFLLRSVRRRNKEHTIQKFHKKPFCRPHPPPILETGV